MKQTKEERRPTVSVCLDLIELSKILYSLQKRSDFLEEMLNDMPFETSEIAEKHVKEYKQLIIKISQLCN